MSYTALVASLKNLRKHPNADRLMLADAAGSTIIVGTENFEGELGIFFPEGGQLSEAHCAANDLVGRVDAAGNRAGGFFTEKRRVRAVRLRGVASEGFWQSMPAFVWTGAPLNMLNQLHEGDELCSLNGQELCCRYETPAQRRAHVQGGPKKRTTRQSTKYFPKHFDTPQFRHVREFLFAPGDVVYITTKAHGTSQRVGNVLDPDALKPWQLWINKHIYPLFPVPYRYLVGTKNVILRDGKGGGWYGTDEFRYRAIEGIVLHKGEMLYMELVGDVAAGTPVMPSQPIEDKALKAKYGPVMHYRYGCAPGEVKVLVYRITRTNEDGVVTELSWPQVKQRCAELGLQPVADMMFPFCVLDDHAALGDTLDSLLEGPDPLDSTHIREGIVIRVENELGVRWAKHKSFEFKRLEGLIRDSDSFVDPEEVA